MSKMPSPQPLALRGSRILVVEDEYMIAEEIAGALLNAGATTIGPVPRVDDAMRLIRSEGRIDGAVLDVNLGKEAIWPVVDMLMARSVPVVLGTGYDASNIPPAYAHLPRREKPASGQDLAQALAQALAPGTGPQPRPIG